MNIKTSGRKVTLRQSFLDTIEKRMAKFDKYFESDAEATVRVTVEGNRKTVEITVRNRGFIYRAEKTEQDMDLAFQAAADLIDKQIVRNKSKLGSRIKKQEANISDDIPYIEEKAYKVVKEKSFVLIPMPVEEAILQMNMLQHSFFVFLNAETGSVGVVYHREDDDYGSLLPQY